MNIEFIELKLKNFLSYGNVEQIIKLNKDPYTLITGINKDESDDMGAKNGLGKTSIFNALHYCLYGKAIGNKVTLPNLVNNINKKNMYVSLTFRKDDTFYRIERGRSPYFVKFFKENDEITDETLGDSRDTQDVIEEVIGMGEELFNQTVLLTKNVPIFMDQTTANQKLIIEKVLGVDIITKKIESLKEKIKIVKGDISNEEFKIQTINTQNETTLGNYKVQLDSFKQKATDWSTKREEELRDKKFAIEQADSIDYNRQYNILKAWEKYNKDKILYLSNKQEHDLLQSQYDLIGKKIIDCGKTLLEYQNIDIEQNKKNFEYNEQIKVKQDELNKRRLEKKAEEDKYKKLCQDIDSKNKEKDKLQKTIDSLAANKCPVCGQPMNQQESATKMIDYVKQMEELDKEIHSIDMDIMEVNNNIQSNFKDVTDNDYELAHTDFKTIQEMYEYMNKMSAMEKDILMNKNKLSELEIKLKATDVSDVKEPEEHSCFKDESEMYAFKAKIESFKEDVKRLESETENPYTKSVTEIEEAMNKIIPADDATLKELENNQKHNEILLKLLNSPTSYIRQAILDKSIDYLNQRIKIYLNKLGSTLAVKFNSDMTLNIVRNGVEFGYISSGETGRVSMALTFAFRDAYESLSDKKINLLMIDELIDGIGLDENGKKDLVKCIFEDKSRNIFVVSHDAQVAEKFQNKLNIVKERGFSTVIS